MYPYDILPGIDLYVILLGLAVVAAIVSFSKLSDKLGIEGKVHNFCLYAAIGAVLLGYGSAVVFQALYNIVREGGFVINQGTGATFYGGLIGGAACFLAIYFGIGHFRFEKKIHVKRFWDVTDGAAAAIVIAHSIGRIGCLMAGCCHGAETDAWYGIKMVAINKTVVPTQLFEALFLFALFLLFVYRINNKKSYNLPIYMMGYGVWRFLLEYVRADYRGTTIFSFMTPSQLIAVIMFLAGAALLIVMMKFKMSYKAVVTESIEAEVSENE